MDFLLMKVETASRKQAKPLEGIWEGLGFERIVNLEEDIRDIRRESEEF